MCISITDPLKPIDTLGHLASPEGSTSGERIGDSVDTGVGRLDQ